MNEGYLIAFAVNPIIREKPLAHVYEGRNLLNRWTWLARCEIDLKQHKLMGANLLTNVEGSMVNSALLKNESVESVLEYAPDKMAVTLQSPADLLILHDWVVVKYIKMSTIGDNRKHWVATLPNFDI